jgi:hypothetical protein
MSRFYKMRANRELVSDWLSQYDVAGIDVTMSVRRQTDRGRR